MSGNKSLLDAIRENLQNGELPDGFSLPQKEELGAVKFADGAKDGIGIYHMGKPEITEVQLSLIREAFVFFKNPERFITEMRRFFAEVSPLRGIDAIQNFVYSNTETLDPNAVFHLSEVCLQSDEVNIVKLGLILVELFGESSAPKDIVRTLGLSDEFTIFSVFNMLQWETGNAEIFDLAQKVHGWGRIHAVEWLKPETQEIRDWLLAEGVQNNVVPAYSAYVVFEKAGVASVLKGEITDAQVDQIAAIIAAMLDEGPVRGMSMLSDEDAAVLISDFLRQVQAHKLTLGICELLLQLSEEKRFSAFAAQCNDLLHSPGCREVTEQALTNGMALSLAKILGIPFKEKIFAHMQADFDHGFANCSAIINDVQYREQAVAIFREHLPLQQMRENGSFAEFNKLSYLVNLLEKYPLCGTDLVTASLEMQDTRCRFTAVNTAHAWCEAKQCKLSELSAELAQAMERTKAAETNERVKMRISECGF